MERKSGQNAVGRRCTIFNVPGIIWLKNLIAFAPGIDEYNHSKQRLKTMNKFMKPYSVACQLISAGIIAVCCQSAHAQLLFAEPFNYTPTSGIAGLYNPGVPPSYTSSKWTGGNSSELYIGSSQLTYAGLQEAAGNELVYIPGTASSTVNTYSAVTSGSIYYSFLIDCYAAPTANNYFTALNPGTDRPRRQNRCHVNLCGFFGQRLENRHKRPSKH